LIVDGYRPPLRAIDLALGAVGLAETLVLPPFEHLATDDVEGVLAGFGRRDLQRTADADGPAKKTRPVG
jgi:hypothetical protein